MPSAWVLEVTLAALMVAVMIAPVGGSRSF